MALLVSDSSVLIDLERGGLLEATFQCELSMVVPDLLYERELKEFNGQYLMQLGLSVTELTPDELTYAQETETQQPKLSLVDCFALSCARRQNHILLAGDGLLRKVAAADSVDCKGLLWLLDQMIASGKISMTQLCDGLTRISQDRRCRLPKAEVSSRLAQWCKS